MLLSAISCLTVGALGNSTDDEADIAIEAGSYEPGSVVVSLIKGAPSVEELLVGFDIVETRAIIDRSDQSTCYYVRFSEETEEIVLEAIAVLSENPYVKYAEPNYYGYIDSGEDDIISDDDVITSDFEAGSVMVCLKKDSPSIEELLSDFDIVESRVFVEYTDQSVCYYVRFAEKTKEIVLEAIAVLNESPYVEFAEPNYYAYIDPVVPSTEPVTTPEITAPETTAPATKPVTEPSTQQASSSTADTATTDTVLIKNSNGTVQTGQNSFMLISALLLIVSVSAAAVYVKFN